MAKKKETVISVRIDADAFRAFSVFDVFRRQRRWKSPALFAAILLAFAAVCLSQVGTRNGALLLAVVLMVLAVGVPAVYVGMFLRSVRQQSKKLGLEHPRLVYRIMLDEAGVSAASLAKQRGTGTETRWRWETLYGAWRVQGAIYLYVAENKAYILPDGQIPGNPDTTWTLCAEKLAEKAHDVRRRSGRIPTGASR